MFKKINYYLIPFLSIILLIGFALPIKAAKFESGDYVLEQSQIVEENLYLEGDVIEIAGVVDGDLVAAGDSIDVSGTITGDLYTAGNSIDISGNIYGSIYTAGQNIDISGSVARSVFVASMFSNITGNVGKDLIVFASNSSITGKVTEDVRVFANRSSITGSVKGEALIYANTSVINQGEITGEVYENIPSQDSKGLNERRYLDLKIAETFKREMWKINIFSTIVGFIGMYIIGAILIYLAPVKTLQIEKKIISTPQEFLYSFLTGLGLSLVLPLPVIILTLTLIGAPLALLITGMYAFLCIFGTIWVESALGYKILSSADKKDDLRYLSLLTGRGLTTIVNFIPIVRGLYQTTLSMVAIGAVVRMKYDSYRRSNSVKKDSKKGKK